MPWLRNVDLKSTHSSFLQTEPQAPQKVFTSAIPTGNRSQSTGISFLSFFCCKFPVNMSSFQKCACPHKNTVIGLTINRIRSLRNVSIPPTRDVKGCKTKARKDKVELVLWWAASSDWVTPRPDFKNEHIRVRQMLASCGRNNENICADALNLVSIRIFSLFEFLHLQLHRGFHFHVDTRDWRRVIPIIHFRRRLLWKSEGSVRLMCQVVLLPACAALSIPGARPSQYCSSNTCGGGVKRIYGGGGAGQDEARGKRKGWETVQWSQLPGCMNHWSTGIKCNTVHTYTIWTKVSGRPVLMDKGIFWSVAVGIFFRLSRRRFFFFNKGLILCVLVHPKCIWCVQTHKSFHTK